MPQYNPLQFQTGLTGIAGAVGGPGFAEGGRQMGLSSRAITEWFNNCIKKILECYKRNDFW